MPTCSDATAGRTSWRSAPACRFRRDGVSEPILDAVRGVPAVAGIPGLDALSVSIGVAALQPPDEAWDSLVERADKALCRAKQEGRDRVVEAPAGD